MLKSTFGPPRRLLGPSVAAPDKFRYDADVVLFKYLSTILSKAPYLKLDLFGGQKPAALMRLMDQFPSQIQFCDIGIPLDESLLGRTSASMTS